MIRLAKGWTTFNETQPLRPALLLERPAAGATFVSSDGRTSQQGASSTTLRASVLGYDEMWLLMEQFGFGEINQSVPVTVILPTEWKIDMPYWGYAHLTIGGDTGLWWADVEVQLTGLVMQGYT